MGDSVQDSPDAAQGSAAARECTLIGAGEGPTLPAFDFENQQQHQGVSQRQQQQQLEQRQPSCENSGDSSKGTLQQQQQQLSKGPFVSRPVLAPVTNTLWSRPLTSMFDQKGSSAPKTIMDFFSPRGARKQQAGTRQEGQQSKEQQQQLSPTRSWHGSGACNSTREQQQEQQRLPTVPIAGTGNVSLAVPPVLQPGARSGLLPV
jgi:hypothetical protein